MIQDRLGIRRAFTDIPFHIADAQVLEFPLVLLEETEREDSLDEL